MLFCQANSNCCSKFQNTFNAETDNVVVDFPARKRAVAEKTEAPTLLGGSPSRSSMFEEKIVKISASDQNRLWLDERIVEMSLSDASTDWQQQQQQQSTGAPQMRLHASNTVVSPDQTCLAQLRAQRRLAQLRGPMPARSQQLDSQQEDDLEDQPRQEGRRAVCKKIPQSAQEGLNLLKSALFARRSQPAQELEKVSSQPHAAIITYDAELVQSSPTEIDASSSWWPW